MSRWLLAPVKPLAEAKSRLAPVLAADERTALMRRLLQHTLALAHRSDLFSSMLVISRDRSVWQIAESEGALALPEVGDNLNSALEQGAQHACLRGATSLLVLPADLPLLLPADLEALCCLGEQEGSVVIGRAQDGGTNALHLHLPAPIRFCFGVDSFDRHWAAVVTAGLTPLAYDSPTLRFDLDQPEHWLALSSVAESGFHC